MREYNYSIDYAIAFSLHKYDSLTFRGLKRTIESQEYLYRNNLSRDTFYSHVKKMRKGGYIYAKNGDTWSRGRKIYLCITPSTREQIELNTLVIQYEENNKKEEISRSYQKSKKYHHHLDERSQKELKRKSIYYIIFRVLSIEAPNRRYEYPGFSVTDIIKARVDGHAFWYLDLEKDRSIVEECINNLQKENIVKGTEISAIKEEEPRYELIDPLWVDLVIDCAELLENTIMNRLHLVWYNIRRPTPEERLYHGLCWGERNTDMHMDWLYNDTREDEEKRYETIQHQIAEVNYLIECLDNTITKVVRVLQEKYHNLKERHSWLYNVIIETIYPKFLQEEVERTVSNPNNKSKKYPRLQRVLISDVIDDGNSVDSNGGREKITII